MSEIGQVPAKPLPEGSDLPPIDPVKLIALLDRYLVRSVQSIKELTDPTKTAFENGVWYACYELKKDILEKHRDLEVDEK